MSHFYRPEIDVLRAIAVSSVVAYHLFPNIFNLGYLGVDLFFVISGYFFTFFHIFEVFSLIVS